MSEEIVVTALTISKEYTLRLRYATERSRSAQEDLHRNRQSCLSAESCQDLVDDVEYAARIAERGFRFDQLLDIPNANGVWLAAEAIIISHEVRGTSFDCFKVPGCSAARICAMNSLVDRKIEDGYRPSYKVTFHQPVLYDAMADGCPKMDHRALSEISIGGAAVQHYVPDSGSAW